jgi:MFS family permease
MLGQAVGPAFGGLLTQYLGFRSIFYFLFILGFIALSTIVILLPETLRNLAGNGTICLHGWRYRPLSYRLLGLPEPVLQRQDPELAKNRQKINWKEMVTGPARMLCEKDVFVTLLFGSVVYAVWSMVTASTTHLFQAQYHLSDLAVGFAFLPNGISIPSHSISIHYTTHS